MRLLCLIVFVLPMALTAQSSAIGTLEKELFQNQQQIARTEHTLDSLNIQLTDLQKQLKPKAAADKHEAVQRKILELSQKVVRLQNEKRRLEDQEQKQRTKLAQLYTQVIDSLSRRLKKEKDSKQKEKIRNALQTYWFKRFRVSPLLARLSYNPQKIENIQKQSLDDSLKQLLVKDYLRHALGEVDTVLATLQTKRQELTAILRLNQKARQFMDELDDSALPLTLSRGTAQSFSPAGRSEDNAANFNASSMDLALEQALIELPRLQTMLEKHNEKGNLSGLDSLLMHIRYSEALLKTYRRFLEQKLND